MTPSIHAIIYKIFDDHDKRSNAVYSVPPDYTDQVDAIVSAWQKTFSANGLSVQLVQQIHECTCTDKYLPIINLHGMIEGFANAGDYRTTPSSAPSHIHDKRIVFIPPEQISQSMNLLIGTMNNVILANPSEELLIENILAFYLEFILIHPFVDHNGRTVNILMELLASQSKLPPFHISHIHTLYHDELIQSTDISRDMQNIMPFNQVLTKYKSKASYAFVNYINQKEKKQ